MSRHEQSFKLAKGDAPGLSCAPEGLTLRGAHLLRRTSEGFVPRPTSEIDALLRAAYGESADAVVLAPGLDLIARALNTGDLGRAMVGAVHLRLPGLVPQAAERIAKADDALAKYDASENRDALGRWTTDGEAGSGGAPSKDHASASGRDQPLLTPVCDKVYPHVTAFRDKHLADAMKLAAVIGHGTTADEVLAVTAKETLYGVDPKATVHGNYFGIHVSGNDLARNFPGQIGWFATDKGVPMASFALKDAFHVSGLIFANRMRNLADGRVLSDPTTFFRLPMPTDGAPRRRNMCRKP
jgi:hypothetical protein